jgi:hypothetical protein
LLHVPAKTSLGFQDVQVPRLMYVKLIEEILRYAEKRNQLFDKQVSYMIDLDNPIRRGNEYIVPEKSAAWYELMRFEWAQKADEKGIYLEEKSAKGEGEAYGVIGPEFSLPESVKTYLDSEDVKVAELRRRTSTLLSILGLKSITGQDFDPPLTPSSQKLTEKQVSFLVRQIRTVVIQLDIRREPFDFIIKKPYGSTNTTQVFFLIIEDDDVSIVVKDPIGLALPIISDMPTSIQEKIKTADVIGAPVAPVKGSMKEAILKRLQEKKAKS